MIPHRGAELLQPDVAPESDHDQENLVSLPILQEARVTE
jgi:hypothetical protein